MLSALARGPGGVSWLLSKELLCVVSLRSRSEYLLLSVRLGMGHGIYRFALHQVRFMVICSHPVAVAGTSLAI